MPPVVGAIGAVAGLVGGAGFGAVLTQALIGTAINFAVGAVIDFITPDAPANDNAAAGVELDFRAGANVPLSAIMGIKDCPGHWAYHNSYGSDNEFLQLLFIDGNGAHDAMFGYLVDNLPAALEGSNADPRGHVITKFKVNGDGQEAANGEPHAWVKYYTGAAGQGADSELVARSRPVGRWTNECRMTATAYRVVTLKYNSKVFGGAIPQMRALWRGLKLYNRRKDSTQPGGSGAHRWGQPSTYEWSENPAICQDSWRRGIWINGVKLLGLGVTEHDCHHAGIVSAANVCDEQVVYSDTGRTLPRYVIGIEIKDGTDPISMMKLFEASMGGYGVEYGGAYTPLPAQTMVSVLTLRDQDRVAGADVLEQTRMSPVETKTAFHGKFLNPETGWLPDDYNIRFNAVAESQEGGRRLEPFDATFVRHREIASTLAEIKVRRDRYSAIELATFGPRAANVKPGHVITRESELLGTVQMLVLAVQRQPKKQFRLSLRGWNNAIVPTPSAGFLPLPVQPLPAPVPVRLTHPLAPLAVAIDQVSGKSRVPGIRFTFTPILDASVDRVVVKYWPTATPDDVRYASSDEPATGTIVIESPAPDTEYQLVATIVTTPTRITSWTNPVVVVTGPLVVIMDDGALADLAKDVLDQLGMKPRQLIESFKQLGTLIEGVDRENYTKRETLFREIGVQLGELEASFTEVIEVALGPGGAIALKLESLYAAMGGNNAQVNVRWEAVAAPAGYKARYSIQAAVDDGVFRAATFFLDVPEDPTKPTRIGFMAGNTVFYLADGTPIALFDELGNFRSSNSAVLIAMAGPNSGNFRFGTGS